MIKIAYKGYVIRTVGSQGIGSFSSPLTNVPFGYIIEKDGTEIDKWLKCYATEEGALSLGKDKVLRFWGKERGLNYWEALEKEEGEIEKWEKVK